MPANCRTFEVISLLLMLGVGAPLRAGAQAAPPDRIANFDSTITVEMDRTVHFEERIEIVNTNGFFDFGLIRRLEMKTTNDRPSKQVSFRAINATVDGQGGVVRSATADGELSITVMSTNGGLSRGRHSIKLNYDAENLVASGSGHETLDENITGTWSLPIEHATLNVKIPTLTGMNIGARVTSPVPYSGVDCTAQDTPDGTRFEAPSVIQPGGALVVRLRVPGASDFYFLPTPPTPPTGFRGFLENHFVLFAWGIACAGVGGFLAIGFAVAGLLIRGSSYSVTDHRVSLVVGFVAMILSTIYLWIGNGFEFATMPGIIVGAFLAFIASGNVHNYNLHLASALAVLINFGFYYLIARGIRMRVWRRSGTSQEAP